MTIPGGSIVSPTSLILYSAETLTSDTDAREQGV
jgi:hypothetical protein